MHKFKKAICLLSFMTAFSVPYISAAGFAAHPRLLYTRDDAARVNALMPSSPQLQKLQSAITARADELLSVPDMSAEKVSDLGMAREYVNRMMVLGIAYRQTGDMKYAARMEESLRFLCSLDTWYPAHYLNVAEMTAAVAVAYDWTFDVLSDETKSAVKNAIYNNALRIVLREYEVGKEGSYVKRNTNWNVVCNTGMVLGALALAEDYPDVVETVVKNAAGYMPNCLCHFAPDGVCYEGPSYYEYTNIYLAMCMKALDDNFGETFGISDLPGISLTARYYVHTISPSDLTFNFADSGFIHPSSASPLFFEFSRKFGLADVATWYRGKLDRVLSSGKLPSWHFPLALAWYDDAVCADDYKAPSIETYHNVNDILVLRGDSADKKSIFLMAKGGDPDMAHQQADGGSFVVESEGVRWLMDLGCDDYSLPDFFTYQPDARRWTYFRESSLSHNTLSIDEKCQYSLGTAHFTEEGKNARKPYAVFDMTSLYPAAGSVTRRFELTDDRTVTVTDIVKTDAVHEICWRAATNADVTVDDGSVVLAKDGKKFRLSVISPSGASFKAVPAKPFTKYEKPLDGVTMILCPVTKAGTTKIQVRMTSL